MKTIAKKIVCLVIVLSVVFVTACNGNTQRAMASTDLMEGITPKSIPLLNVNKDELALLKPFYFDLMRKVYTDKQSIVISPTSVTYALGMTLNGAKGETKTQMENVLGTNSQKLNELLYLYKTMLPEGEDCNANLANAIWFNDNEELFKPNNVFLQKNADYYGAGLYKAKFDKSTVNDINSFVDKNTKGRIKKIVTEDVITPFTIMCLVNALSFDAKWHKEYESSESGTFTDIKGSPKQVDFMKSTESAYFENENAVGTMKRYSNYNYAFVALQPKQGVTLSDMVNSMTASTFTELFNTASYDFDVKTTLPKFKVEYGLELNKTLIEMGLVDAFTEHTADFSNMCESEQNEDIFISKVIHKAYIEVNEVGTKAGAATAVVVEKSSAPEPKPIKTLVFDKPFMYMILDTTTLLPLFIGTYLG